MKTKYFVSIVLFILVSFSLGCGLFKTTPARYQARFLPEQLGNLYLGMPFAEFEQEKDLSAMESSDLFSFRISYVEQPKDKDVKEITYYIETENNPEKPLYEFIVEYQQGFNLGEYIVKKYGPPNHDGEWRFDSQEGFEIMVWTFDNKLVIAGKMAGTEWDE